MPSHVFRYQHRVTYSECTAGNHIYYSRYLDLLEAARGELFRKTGLPLIEWQRRDIAFPVVECRLRYKAPTRYDDLLTVELWPTAARGIRLNFACRILNQNAAVILEGETCHVCAGTDERPRRLPEDLISALQPFLAALEHPA